MRYARNIGYLGIAAQSEQGTAVDPTHFIKYQGSPSMTPEMQYEQYNEGGDSQYPGITLKERHNPNGDFELLARPDISGLIFALLLGSDTVTGEAAPYTHTIVPSDPEDQPWATLERAIADEIFERTTDVRIVEVSISGEPGKPIVLGVTYQGLSSGIESAGQEVSYEDAMPFIFWQGQYTADDTDISEEVTEFEITVTNVYDEDEQHSELVRGDMTLIRREISVSFSYKVNEDNVDDYEAVYYDTAGAPAEAMHEGSLEVELEYGETTGIRSLSIEIPNITHTQRIIELDSDSTESQAFECEGHAQKVGEDEFIEVVVRNTDSTAYVS